MIKNDMLNDKNTDAVWTAYNAYIKGISGIELSAIERIEKRFLSNLRKAERRAPMYLVKKQVTEQKLVDINFIY